MQPDNPEVICTLFVDYSRKVRHRARTLIISSMSEWRGAFGDIHGCSVIPDTNFIREGKRDRDRKAEGDREMEKLTKEPVKLKFVLVFRVNFNLQYRFFAKASELRA